MYDMVNLRMLYLALAKHAQEVVLKDGYFLDELLSEMTFSCKNKEINDLKVGTHFQIQSTDDTFTLSLKAGEREGFEEVVERYYKDTFNIPVITKDDFCAITKDFSPYANASDVYSLALRKAIHEFDPDNRNNLSIADRLALYHMIKFIMEKQPDNKLVQNIKDKGLFQKLQVGILELAAIYKANNKASIEERNTNIVADARFKNFKEPQQLSLTHRPAPNLRNG